MANRAIFFNPIFVQDVEKAYNTNIKKSKLLKLATIINFFVITVFAIYLFSLISISTTSMPIVHIMIGITAPLLGVLFSRLLISSKKCFNTAMFYKNVIKEQNILNKQSQKDIKKYLKKINAHPKNIKKSIKAIAYFKAWELKKIKYFKEIEKLEKNDSTDPNLKYILQKQIHDIYENEILRSKLKQAEIFHLIENPTSQKKLEDFGSRISLSFSKRQAAILSNADVYFIFKDEIQKQKNRKWLTSKEIKELAISDISKLIF